MNNDTNFSNIDNPVDLALTAFDTARNVGLQPAAAEALTVDAVLTVFPWTPEALAVEWATLARKVWQNAADLAAARAEGAIEADAFDMAQCLADIG